MFRKIPLNRLFGLFFFLCHCSGAGAAAKAHCVTVRAEALRPIISTHTLPPYPSGQPRVAIYGTTILNVFIKKSGAVKRIAIEKSAGWPPLDTAAANHVKAQWKWNKLSYDCAVTTVAIQWEASAKPNP